MKKSFADIMLNDHETRITEGAKVRKKLDMNGN